jgi:hypothetical protein
MEIRGYIHKFPDWPPGERTACSLGLNVVRNTGYNKLERSYRNRRATRGLPGCLTCIIDMLLTYINNENAAKTARNKLRMKTHDTSVVTAVDTMRAGKR